MNTGNGMNLATGVFTAPRDGIYHFQFSGVADDNSLFGIDFVKNDQKVVNVYPASSGSKITGFLYSMLKLERNDRVYLISYMGTLHAHPDYLSYFSGWVSEEDPTL